MLLPRPGHGVVAAEPPGTGMLRERRSTKGHIPGAPFRRPVAASGDRQQGRPARLVGPSGTATF